MTDQQAPAPEFDFAALPITTTYCGKVDAEDWPHYLWTVVISPEPNQGKTPAKPFVTQYKTGLGIVEKKPGAMPMPNPPYRKNTIAHNEWMVRNTRPKKPTNKDIMHSLLLDADAGGQSFNDWCANYDYSNDSMKAFEIYQECCKTAEALAKLFTPAQREAMRAALEDY